MLPTIMTIDESWNDPTGLLTNFVLASGPLSGKFAQCEMPQTTARTSRASTIVRGPIVKFEARIVSLED